MPRAAGAAAALTLLACTGSEPGRVAPAPGVPIDAKNVFGLAWIGADEVVTVEDVAIGAAAAWTTWRVLNVRTGASRVVEQPPARGCRNGASAESPVRVRDGVIVYVEACRVTSAAASGTVVGRYRIRSYDFATPASRDLADLGRLVVDGVATDSAGFPRWVEDNQDMCAAIQPLREGRSVASIPLPVTDDPPWDAGDWLRRVPGEKTDCTEGGRAALVALDGKGSVAFAGSKPRPSSAEAMDRLDHPWRVYVTGPDAFAPRPVRPELVSPVDLTWTADGAAVLVTSRRGEHRGLVRIETATGRVTRLLDGDVTSVAVSGDGGEVAALVRRDGRQRLVVLPTA